MAETQELPFAHPVNKIAAQMLRKLRMDYRNAQLSFDSDHAVSHMHAKERAADHKSLDEINFWRADTLVSEIEELHPRESIPACAQMILIDHPYIQEWSDAEKRYLLDAALGRSITMDTKMLGHMKRYRLRRSRGASDEDIARVESWRDLCVSFSSQLLERVSPPDRGIRNK